MMPKYKRFISYLPVLLPAVLVFALTGCGGIHVTTDYSHRIDFAQYHTYSWLKVSAGTDLWASRIQRDVDAQLLSKGWMEVPAGGQASVTAFGSTKQQPTLETFYSSFGPDFGGWYWGWGPGFWGPGLNQGVATTQTVYTPIGTLVVDIFNSTNKHLVWRGVAQQALSGSPAKNEVKLEKAVAKMFRNFPPPSKG